MNLREAYEQIVAEEDAARQKWAKESGHFICERLWQVGVAFGEKPITKEEFIHVVRCDRCRQLFVRLFDQTGQK